MPLEKTRARHEARERARLLDEARSREAAEEATRKQHREIRPALEHLHTLEPLFWECGRELGDLLRLSISSESRTHWRSRTHWEWLKSCFLPTTTATAEEPELTTYFKCRSPYSCNVSLYAYKDSLVFKGYLSGSNERVPPEVTSTILIEAFKKEDPRQWLENQFDAFYEALGRRSVLNDARP